MLAAAPVEALNVPWPHRRRARTPSALRRAGLIRRTGVLGEAGAAVSATISAFPPARCRFAAFRGS